MSIFEVRRYNGIYLIGAHYPRQIKFTIIIKYWVENRQKINRKNQSISSTGVLIVHCFNQKYNFCAITSFSLSWRTSIFTRK